MGKNRKKKIKRTPQQLQIIRQRQYDKMMENQLKKVIEIENRIKLQNDKMMEIKNQLTEDDWKDCYYHITQTYKWDIINKEGLKGGDGKKWGGKNGYLFMTDKNDRELWNGIGCQYVMDFNDLPTHNEEMMERFSNKKVTVIGIPKGVFELMNLKETVSDDYGGESMNYDFNHKKVLLGKTVIPSFLFKKVDEFMTDNNLYDTVTIWKYLHQQLYKIDGELTPLDELYYDDGLLGFRTYKDRFKTTTENFLRLSNEERDKYKDRIKRDRILRGTDKFFHKEPQQKTSHNNIYEVTKDGWTTVEVGV